MLKKLLVVTLCFMMLMSSVSFGQGSLVIVGGALRSDNDEVYEKFIELAGGKDAKIGIVPVASGSPIKYSNLFTEDMLSRGIKEENIVLIKLAVKNDKRTDEDESLWKDNAFNPIEIEKIKSLDAIWFVGGDQLRITETLLDTPMLDEIHALYQRGGVVGGTSAGAAMMSEVMIAGGDSFGALHYGEVTDYDDSTLDYQNQGGLVTSKGLGFFTQGIIDQHFDRKGRLGRLIVVGYEHKETYPISFGVEENTALIFNGSTKEVTVAGTGGVVVVDVEHAVKKGQAYEQVDISYLESVDKYDLNNKTFIMDESKYTTLGYEYMYTENPVGSGAVSSNQTLKTLIAYQLVDNEAADSVSTYLFNHLGEGYEFKFSNYDLTEGYWGQNGAADLYSFEHVRLDIYPVDVAIRSKQDSRLHTVEAGDVLWKIALTYKTSLEELIRLNEGINPDRIFIGQEIKID